MSSSQVDEGNGNTHGGTGRAELLQHVGDEDLEESLTEEALPHRTAVIVKLLRKTKKETRKA